MVTSLALTESYLAADTCSGAVRVWRRMPGPEFVKLLEDDLQINASRSPCHTVVLGRAPDDSTLLVAHSAEKNRFGVWRLVRTLTPPLLLPAHLHTCISVSHLHVAVHTHMA